MTSSSPAGETPPPAYAHSAIQQPPPLPHRASRRESHPSADPSLYTMSAQDPRSSSTHSLVPEPESEWTGRRKLLLIYMHGFMGNETSFQSFPAHVHNLVTITLADTHIVHTKIYPKYKSRYALEVARDEFSAWLSPNENPTTDIVLLGHSMGGLLAADVTLLLRHHITGTVNFDTPFLGMHPGVVKSGLQSIFKPASPPQHQASLTTETNDSGKRPSRMNTLFNPKPTDPNYNPSFTNDVRLPMRKGWENALHFMSKHSNELFQASKAYVASHLEFGGAMADYRHLKERYARIRALEEEDENKRRAAVNTYPPPPRIRFVNYYTASTGRPKQPKSPKSPLSRPPTEGTDGRNESVREITGSRASLEIKPPSATVSPRISLEEHRGNEVIPKVPEEPLSANSPHHTTFSNTPSMENTGQYDERIMSDESLAIDNDSVSGLPETPPIPQEPPFVDLALYTDKAERKAAEKEHSRALKEYQRAVKHRNKIINERAKMQERLEKQQKQENRRLEQQLTPNITEASQQPTQISPRTSMEADMAGLEIGVTGQTHPPEPLSHPYSNYAFSRSGILSAPPPDDRVSLSDTATLASQSSHDLTPTSSHPSVSPPKPKRYKKFCMLPPKDASGNKDPTWVRIFMKDVDEVGAHCGLFFMSETYERLVGDVGGRIEEWVREAEGWRVAMEMQDGG